MNHKYNRFLIAAILNRNFDIPENFSVQTGKKLIGASIRVNSIVATSSVISYLKSHKTLANNPDKIYRDEHKNFLTFLRNYGHKVDITMFNDEYFLVLPFIAWIPFPRSENFYKMFLLGYSPKHRIVYWGSILTSCLREHSKFPPKFMEVGYSSLTYGHDWSFKIFSDRMIGIMTGMPVDLIDRWWKEFSHTKYMKNHRVLSQMLYYKMGGNKYIGTTAGDDELYYSTMRSEVDDFSYPEGILTKPLHVRKKLLKSNPNNIKIFTPNELVTLQESGVLKKDICITDYQALQMCYGEDEPHPKIITNVISTVDIHTLPDGFEFSPSDIDVFLGARYYRYRSFGRQNDYIEELKELLQSEDFCSKLRYVLDTYYVPTESKHCLIKALIDGMQTTVNMSRNYTRIVTSIFSMVKDTLSIEGIVQLAPNVLRHNLFFKGSEFSAIAYTIVKKLIREESLSVLDVPIHYLTDTEIIDYIWHHGYVNFVGDNQNQVLLDYLIKNSKNNVYTIIVDWDNPGYILDYAISHDWEQTSKLIDAWITTDGSVGLI